MNQKPARTIDVKTAMDNLAAVIGIDLNNAPPIAIIRKSRLLANEAEISSDMTPWLAEEGADPILEVLDISYQAILRHLEHLYDSGEMNWKNKKSKEGISSMMAMVGESAKKMEDFLNFRMEEPLDQHIAKRESFQNLQNYYTQVFAPKFEVDSAAGQEKLEKVQSDAEYELFYIRNEDGKPYFDKELIKNLKITSDFNLDESFEEDPILKVRTMVDKDLHASAAQILNECHAVISDFFKIANQIEENELAKSLSMALSALLLSTNSKNLIQNTVAKSSLQYFNDFQTFLRRAMRTTEYQKLLAYPPESDKVEKLLLYLTHSLCKSIFDRVGGVKLESIGLIHRTMRRGEETKQKKKDHLLKGDSVWNQFLLDDEKYRTLLAQFPNGPIFKILDLIREESDEDTIIPFDPIGQENIPSRIYEIERKGRKIDVIRIPSPTRQSYINKVDVSDEFKGFLRSMSQTSHKQKHLLINLQDRTSWKEFARSSALETLQKNAEFSHELVVITLPKDTDFYHQINEYFDLSKSEEFMDVFFNQLKTPEECGYFFPPQIKPADLLQFAEEALPAIHQYFFHGKNTLPRRDREDFIEIFYQFLILKCIDLLEPTSISFTCKDAIDTGAAQAGTFFGFVKLINGDFTKREEQDFLRWIVYTPALFIRERAVNGERLNRTLSALERFDIGMAEEGKEVIKVLGECYESNLLKTINVHHL